MLQRVTEAIGSILGSAFGIFICGLMLFSLPLNVIVWMRWTGWEWWGALIATLFAAMIPGLGQLGYFVLTFIGLYYFYDAGWDWRRATDPAPVTFSIGSLSPAEFERFKTKTIQPSLLKQCTDEARVRADFGGKIPISSARYCECFARVAVAATNQSDLAYQETHNAQSPGFRARLEARVRAECS